VPLFPPQIPRGLTRARTRASAMRGRRLTAWAMAWPRKYVNWETKSKAVPLHAMVALGGERKYSPYSFLTSALDGDEWSASRPVRALPPGKGPRYPLYSRLGGPVWTQRLEKIYFASAFTSADNLR
jgi:hypothetical protein